MREAASEPDEALGRHLQPDLLLGLPGRVGERLAGTEVAADRDVERTRPRVLRLRAALEEDERPALLVEPADPDVESRVPVAVAMDVAATLPAAGRHPVGVEDVELLVLRIGGARPAAQNRSSTPCRAPSETSWSFSSLRPG